MTRINKFKEHILLEKVSISEDTNKLTEFILNNLSNLPNTFITNLPILSFKLKKIIIDFNSEPNTDGSFDIHKSKLNGIGTKKKYCGKIKRIPLAR